MNLRRAHGQRWAALAVAALAALGGCAVDQRKEVARYRGVVNVRAPAYRAGEPLSLREALLLTNRNNENLDLSGEAYLRALNERRRAVAGFLPTVDVVGTYLHAGRAPGGGQNNSVNAAAEGTIDLFSGFRDVHRYWRDTYLIEEERNHLLDTQEALLLDTAGVYFQVLRSEASVRVLESSLAVQAERLRDTRGRLAAGVARPLDVAQTEAQVAATRTTLVNARRDASNARSLLALLTGAAVREAPLADAYALPPRVGPLEGFLAAAREERSDLDAARAAVTAARRDVEVAWGQYYPTVSLDLTSFLYRETVPVRRDWEGLLAVRVPVFRAGLIEADVRDAWSAFRQALLLRAYLGRQVDQEVRQAYEDLAASEARLAELQVQVAAAEQAFRQADASYRVGLATNLERVTAQDELLEAQLQLASAEFDRKVQHLTLVQRTGGLREDLEAMPPAGAGALADARMPELGVAPAEGFDLKPVAGPTTRPAPSPNTREPEASSVPAP